METRSLIWMKYGWKCLCEKAPEETIVNGISWYPRLCLTLVRPINLEEHDISMKTWRPVLQWGHSTNELPEGDLHSDSSREAMRFQPFFCTILLPAVPRWSQEAIKVPKTWEPDQQQFWLRHGDIQITSKKDHQDIQSGHSHPLRRGWTSWATAESAWLWDGLNSILHCLQGHYQESRTRLFTGLNSWRMREPAWTEAK